MKRSKTVRNSFRLEHSLLSENREGWVEEGQGEKWRKSRLFKQTLNPRFSTIILPPENYEKVSCFHWLLPCLHYSLIIDIPSLVNPPSHSFTWYLLKDHSIAKEEGETTRREPMPEVRRIRGRKINGVNTEPRQQREVDYKLIGKGEEGSLSRLKEQEPRHTCTDDNGNPWYCWVGNEINIAQHKEMET